jgi:uncharacterized LabA/DUF88 family protein
MSIDLRSKRVALFVDLISQFHNVNTVYSRQKIDYRLYLDRLKEEGNVTRAIAYGAAIGNEANPFIHCLRENGYEVKYVVARKFNGRPIIKYTDRTMDIVIDIIRMLDRLDVVVIGSCNVNLAPLINYLKEKGIIVLVYACNIPKELRLICDEFWEISEDVFEIKNNEEEEYIEEDIEEEELRNENTKTAK